MLVTLAYSTTDNVVTYTDSMYSLRCSRVAPVGSEVGVESVTMSVMTNGGTETRIRSTTPPTFNRTNTASSLIIVDDNDK